MASFKQALQVSPMVIGLALLLSACKPSEPAVEPAPFPALAGAWKPAFTKRTCEQNYVRFAGNVIVSHEKGLALPGLEIRRKSANGAEIDLDLTPSRLVGAMSKKDPAKVAELMAQELRVTLTVRGDKVAVRDAQMNDPVKGLRVPTPSERRMIEKLFTLERCSAVGTS